MQDLTPRFRLGEEGAKLKLIRTAEESGARVILCHNAAPWSNLGVASQFYRRLL